MMSAPVPVKRPPRNNHAVALANRRKSTKNQLTLFTPSQRLEYLRWMTACREAKRHGRPRPPEPWFVRMRRELLHLDLDERVERTRQAAQTALGAFHALKDLLSHRPGPIGDTALVHAKAMADAVAALVELCGVPLNGEEKKPASQQPPDVTYL